MVTFGSKSLLDNLGPIYVRPREAGNYITTLAHSNKSKSSRLEILARLNFASKYRERSTITKKADSKISVEKRTILT